MKKIKRLVLYVLATTVMAAGFCVESNAAYATENKIYDGKVIKGRTYGPIRAIGEELGAKVKWNNKAKVATVIKGNDVLTLKLGSKILKVNNRNIQMDVSVHLEDGKTYLPLRYIGEALGYEIYWDKRQQLTYLYADPAITVYSQPIFYKAGYELLENAISATENLSAIPQKRAHLKSYFTDEMISKIIQKGGLNLEVHPSTEYEWIHEYYSYPDAKTMGITRNFMTYPSVNGLGDVIQYYTLEKEDGKWLVSDIVERWYEFRP